MPRRKRWDDITVSLHGVPFEEALAGVVSVKPPAGEELPDRQAEETDGKKDRPSPRKRKK